nr:putative reverse transcriptase domain-containing protein [Tanacetum cinerariifolium]
MSTLKFADTHNMVVFLEKPTESEGFEQIVDFMSAHTLRESQIHARVDGKEIIIAESSVRKDLQLTDEDGVDCLSNSTIFENLELMRKPNRKNTHVPQPSGSTKHIADEAVHKERGDRLVRAATTASSLEAEQDGGNINKTQSKATPNEASSSRTTSGGGPRYQEAMGDTIAQTRVENVSKLSNDSQLARARVDSSKDEPNLGEDASKHGRIKAIDADEDTTLVNDQDDVDDAEIFNVDDLHGEEVFVEKEDVNNEELVEIMDREVKWLKRSRIPLVKVRWNSKRGPEFTWECEDQFRKKYPHLFTKTAPSSSAAS